MEELKYLHVFFTSDGRVEQEMNQWVRALSAVMKALLLLVVVENELS